MVLTLNAYIIIWNLIILFCSLELGMKLWTIDNNLNNDLVDTPKNRCIN